MTQISFDSLKPEYKITKPIRLIELFAGIGAQAKALENLGVDFEHYRICEFDKYAVKSYNAIHGSEKNRADFNKWISFLENKGYSNYYADLNSKNYGVAQNRNRCFMVSILGDYNYEFPAPVRLDKTMSDYLDETVDEKYFLSLKGVKYVTNLKRDRFIKINSQIGCAIMAGANSNWTGNFVTCDLAGNLCGEKWEKIFECCRRVYLQSGISPIITTQQGGEKGVKIEVNQEPLRLRKLTPRECFRLMSFTDEDIDKCYAVGMSDSQLYKQAGNSIVVSVLERIFEQLI